MFHRDNSGGWCRHRRVTPIRLRLPWMSKSSRVRRRPDVSKVTVAASVPSLDDVMRHQYCVLALDVHVSPESVDVQIFPPRTTASLVPSLDDVIPYQYVVLALPVHVEALTEASEANESNAAEQNPEHGFWQHLASLFS